MKKFKKCIVLTMAVFLACTLLSACGKNQLEQQVRQKGRLLEQLRAETAYHLMETQTMESAGGESLLYTREVFCSGSDQLIKTVFADGIEYLVLIKGETRYQKAGDVWHKTYCPEYVGFWKAADWAEEAKAFDSVETREGQTVFTYSQMHLEEYDRLILENMQTLWAQNDVSESETAFQKAKLENSYTSAMLLAFYNNGQGELPVLTSTTRQEVAALKKVDDGWEKTGFSTQTLVVKTEFLGFDPAGIEQEIDAVFAEAKAA